MRAVCVILTGLLATVPPLSSEHRTALETARDGRDHREAAFVALVEHVRTWTGGPGDAPIRLRPDLDALVADPAAHRGDLCRVSGFLQQRTPLAAPHDGVEEWFLRRDEDAPLIVYVVGDPGPLRDGQHVQIAARFYKPIDAVARDGATRTYAAFVGADPIVGRRAGGTSLVWVPVVPVVVLMIVFLVILLRTRARAARVMPRGSRLETPTSIEPLDDGAPLPDDPAEALAELRRRAEASHTSESTES